MSKRHTRVYWDTSVWIAWNRNQHGARALCTEMLRAAEVGNLTILLSPLVIAEFAPQDPKVDEQLAKYLQRSSFVMIQFSKHIAEQARNLVRKHRSNGLRGADAAHIASAIYAGADEVHSFDTHFLGIDGQVPGVKICRPQWTGQAKLSLDSTAPSAIRAGD